MLLRLVTGCLVLAAFVAGHRSLPTGVSCGNQFNSSVDALEIPNPSISWASYRILTCDTPVFWLKAAANANQNLSFTALVPLIPRFEPVRLSVMVIGPSLPSLTTAEQAKAPQSVLANIQGGEGAILFESPDDQSSCAHLTSTQMASASTVYGGRCHFHEPYGDSRMWVLLDQTLKTQAAGTHRFAVFVRGKSATKLSFTCCDWPEDFVTAFPIPAADCPYCSTKASSPLYSSLFFEHKTMVNHSGFPAFQDCAVDPSPPIAPTANQCPDEAAIGSGSAVNQPESCQLGCVGEECHSHNTFGECTYTLDWITPKPAMNGANVTSLILFKGDTVRFSSAGYFEPHNLVEMASGEKLAACDWAGSVQLLTVEEARLGKEMTFATAGTRYFSCQMTGHCELGMKLKVEVKDSSEGRRCHSHGGTNSSASVTPACPAGEVRAYLIGSADYGAHLGQCSELCAPAMALQWITGASRGACADAGFPAFVEAKSVQPPGSPVGVAVRILADGSCHCHSYEHISCNDTGDTLYSEHIVEIQTYCGGIVNGTDSVCPYKCFQPFEILHLNYLECSSRPKHPLYLAIDAIGKCHKAAPAPAGTLCTDASGSRQAIDFSAGHSYKGTDGASTFALTSMLIHAAVTVAVGVAVISLVFWKRRAIERPTRRAFKAVGRLVGMHPVKVACMTSLLGFAMAGAMAMQESETDPALLWVPVGSVSLGHNQYARTTWPSNFQPDLVFVNLKDGEVNRNLLTPTNLQAMLQMHEQLMAIEVDGDRIVRDSKAPAAYGPGVRGKWTFQGSGATQQKCYKFFGDSCSMQSILGVFGHNASLMSSEAAIQDRIADWEAAPLRSLVEGVFKSFEIQDVLGGIGRDASGSLVSADLFIWKMFLTKDVNVMKDPSVKNDNDPILESWEAEALCRLGMVKKHPMDTKRSCSAAFDSLVYSALFGRSFPDEFRAAIKGDVAMMGVAYFLIIIYLFLNLGKRDVVHSMMAMSFACLACVGLSVAGSNGLGALFGIKSNPLINNIPFLILGLGVDDAFILTAELTRHMKMLPDATVSELIALTAETGGASVLITSFTDALAFLIGASSSLPALSAFCAYAGLAVLLCFLFQIFLFLPLLALNVRRVHSNRLDLLCCLHSKEAHLLEEPKGCCCCLFAPRCNLQDGVMSRAFQRVGDVTVRTIPGSAATLAFWTLIFTMGIAGAVHIRKDFNIEWFFPDDSYVNKVLQLNSEYSVSNLNFHVYTNQTDIWATREAMNKMSGYLERLPFVTQSSIKNWWENYQSWSTSAGPALDAPTFYQNIWTWYQSCSYQDYIQWADDGCNAKPVLSCDPEQGIAHSRIGAVMGSSEDGTERLRSANKMRLDLEDIFGDKSVFPFAGEFLYWEENGVIDEELTRNLIMAAGVVFTCICFTIPQPRVAVLVSLTICMSMVELVGFMYWWGITVNGTSTIYVLICLGLSVDYSAHIAHIFRESTGSRQDRAVNSMTRIGPPVFHALFSTILALVVLGFAKSFVFRIFFKVLFLITMIAGFKGMWLLPVALSLVGGDDDVSKVKVVKGELDQRYAA